MLLAAGLRLPPALHLLAPLAIFELNRRLVVRRRTGRPPARRLVDAFVRGYVAFAFTSIFCALFLAVAAVLALPGLALAPLAPPAVREAAGRAYLWLVNAGFTITGGLLAYGY